VEEYRRLLVARVSVSINGFPSQSSGPDFARLERHRGAVRLAHLGFTGSTMRWIEVTKRDQPLCGVPPTEQSPDFQLLSTEANPARPDTKVILIRHATSHTQLCSNT
jgi:hypothetical protein